MNENRNNDDDYNDWSPWEHQTLTELQEREQQAVYNTEATVQKLFGLFQGAAQCIAVLYKTAADNHSSQAALWTAFQTAAGTITAHHKACVEYVRSCGEASTEAGSQRRTKEILGWARRKRHFRREEMIGFLAGKSPPPKTQPHHSYRGSPRSRICVEQRPRPRLPPSPLHHVHHSSQEQDLATFRDALSFAGSPTSISRRRGNVHHELHTFMTEEFNRNKRPAPSPSPPSDVTMDSPQHKRFKYT